MKNKRNQIRIISMITILLMILVLFEGYSNAKDSENIATNTVVKNAVTESTVEDNTKNKIMGNNTNNETVETKQKEDSPKVEKPVQIQKEETYTTTSITPNNAQEVDRRYDGEMYSDLWYLRAYQSNNKNYIEGNINVHLKIGDALALVSRDPSIQLISLDGKTKLDAYVEYRVGYKGREFYFRFDIDRIDITKKYNLVVTDIYEYNIGTRKSQNVYIIDEVIGMYKGNTVKILNCEIFFLDFYEGEVNTDLWLLNAYTVNNKRYVEGNINVHLKIGNAIALVSQNPTIQLISTDGRSILTAYVEYRVGYKGREFYFRFDMDNFQTGKQYNLVLTDGYICNTSEKKRQNVYIIDETIGKYNEYLVKIKDTKMYLELDYYYDGELSTDLWYLRAYQFNNRNYIEGNINVHLKIGDALALVSTNPKIQLISTDGEKVLNSYVEYRVGYRGREFYFRFDITGIDMTKKYRLVTTDQYICNISDKKSQDVYIINEKIGVYLDRDVKIRDCKLYFPKKSFNGIDVSSHNGDIDWKEVAKTQDFVMIRVGYRGYATGRIVYDTKFLINILRAQEAGMKIGIYFFSQAVNEQEAIEEAIWTANAIAKYNITYPVVIDTEFSNPDKDGRADWLSNEQRTKVVKAFADTIRSRGYIPGIYASRNWFKENLFDDELNNYDRWVAHYTGNPEIQTNYDRPYTMWQYTSSGSVPGINGNVDFNICYKEY